MATTKNTHTGNGTLTTFAFTFPYIKQSDVKVSVDNVDVATSAYSFSDATHVQFNTAPANAAAIAIYRDTDDSNLVATFYPGSAIRSSDLNDNFTQNLYTTQETTNDSAEALDNSRELSDGVYTSAISIANTAKTTATTADTNATAAVSTANTASTNASNAVTTANTANSTASAANTTAAAAETKADTAISTANDAETKADNAVSTANTANTTAGTANTTANDAETKADTAITTANAADTIADAAKLATDTYVHDGTSLKGDGIGSNPKGVAYAVTTAESAQASVSASAIYTVVTNFAALPALSSLSEDKFYQVNDSTNIEDESTVNGEPAGFVGDDELAVKLKSNISSTPKVWEWQEYYATDPETRYRKKLIVENLTTISEDYTIGTGNNGFSIGPVTIAATKTITIPANSKYVVMN